MTPKKRPGGFVLPKFRLRKAATLPMVAMNQQAAGASTDRILAATPTLRAVYDFLRASKARVP